MSGFRSAQRKIWMASAIVGCLFLSGAITLAVLPLAAPDSSDFAIPDTATPQTHASAKTLKKGDFGRSLDKRLQRPLEDPAPAAPIKAAPVKPAPLAALPDVQLLGTAQDSDPQRSMAWLQTPGKPIMLVTIGQSVKTIPGEPIIEKIERGSATLRFGSRAMVIELKKTNHAK